MKTKLLLAALFTASFGFAQTFDNIPTGSGYYINKIMPSPNGQDLTNELLEVRGPAGVVVPSNLYLITIEGDGDRSSNNGIGKVEEAIELGDGTRVFGANGILAVVANYNQDSGGVTAGDGYYENPYTADMDGDAHILTIELEGNNVGSSSSSAVTTQAPDIGWDGNFIDQTATYMLVSSSTNPKGVFLDGDGSAATADGAIDATGDHTLWTLYDSVSFMDEDDANAGRNGEYAYGQIIFARNNNDAGISAYQFTTPGANVVPYGTTSASLMMRQGASTGFTTSDWVVTTASEGTLEFSDDTDKTIPAAFEGYADFNTIYGSLNPTSASLSVEEASVNGFAIYPNPANDILNIKSNNLQISAVSIYSLLGKSVYQNNQFSGSIIDLSSINRGVYILKIEASGRTFSKKLVVQ
ncbi:T9SS type A sorting domain-containing protein [Tamlana sp. 2_MG-2023]|uniref:T9SS type A sorting domain-containing protein n=1 Tax=unclassified Tamlana TaxID=2614803 RepID=UPI0026E44F46|nr:MULTISPECIES: T9SS type A sorting domain-containing protein [unclassified Tamlana]MDO6760477.1 T9SS type A sorting domain-containing protein [Tamlana sp. 2_MG-2023]MDO6790733.1 T9SS type A sorting domain-containing protein [Tamlana sp. 1_MG-2023]